MSKLLSYRIQHPVSRHHLLSMFREIKVLESAVTSATEDRDRYMAKVEKLEKENVEMASRLQKAGARWLSEAADLNKKIAALEKSMAGYVWKCLTPPA